MGWRWKRGEAGGPAQLPACLAAPPRAAMTALLLLKYSVLLATISQRVKARRVSERREGVTTRLTPAPQPRRARQAEHAALRPPRPGGHRQSPWGGGDEHPKCLESSSGRGAIQNAAKEQREHSCCGMVQGWRWRCPKALGARLRMAPGQPRGGCCCTPRCHALRKPWLMPTPCERAAVGIRRGLRAGI